MSDPARALLDKAERAIHAAEVLHKDGEADFAVGRAYYAMLYAAEALLIAKGLRFRKHGSVHAAFGEHFAKGHVLDPKFHRWLLDAYDQRILGDYGVEVSLTEEDAARVIQQAREFLQADRAYHGLKRNNGGAAVFHKDSGYTVFRVKGDKKKVTCRPRQAAESTKSGSGSAWAIRRLPVHRLRL